MLETVEFQDRVLMWMRHCFSDPGSYTPEQRAQRFLEEALELVQATGMSRDHARQLVEYVYDRPVGETDQETGGVMLTLCALATSLNVDIGLVAERELARVHTQIEKIRAKQASKPAMSPLPGGSDGK